MSLDLVDFEAAAREAVRFFWDSRQESEKKNKASGNTDRGKRSAVTAGKNMDGFSRLFSDVVSQNGLPDAALWKQRKDITLPGFFRVTKRWDLLVVSEGQLVAAIEMKSIATSFGKNLNNRAEEAVGNAIDLRTALREGAFGLGHPPPFLGWLILVADCDASRRKNVRIDRGRFSHLDEFDGSSYQDRADLLCKKMIHERLYSQASVIFSREDTSEYSDRPGVTDLRSFVSGLAGHIASYSASRRT